MRISLVIAALLTVSLVQAQGLVSSYDEECSCTVFTNHYDDGSVSAVYRENSAGQRIGEEIVYYENGVIKSERTWDNGRLNGTGKHYYRNGQLSYEENNVNGKKTGLWKFYHEDGTLLQTIDYAGSGNDGVYDYYHAGVKYFSQTLTGGEIVDEQVHNEQIYNQLQEEAANTPAKK